MKQKRTLRCGSRLIVRLSSFNHPNDDLLASVYGHPFNHVVQILLPLPGTANAYKSPLTAAALSEFDAAAEEVSSLEFYVARMDLWALAEEDFIKAGLFCDSTVCWLMYCCMHWGYITSFAERTTTAG